MVGICRLVTDRMVGICWLITDRMVGICRLITDRMVGICRSACCVKVCNINIHTPVLVQEIMRGIFYENSNERSVLLDTAFM
jgi:hypothetical protein